MKSVCLVNMVFKIALILFAVFAALRTWRQYRAQKATRQWFVLWSVVWLLVIGVAVAPQTSDLLAANVGVGRGADLLVYVAIVFLLYAQFRTMVRTKKLHEQQTELVRRIAIERAAAPGSHAT